MSKWDQIHAFIAVVEEQGFSAAARKQQVSTAAISRQVSRLEFLLNAQLLQRSTRRIALTDIGRQYYEQVKNTMDALREAELTISDKQSDAIGQLTVTSNRYFATHYLLPRLAEFMALNPKLQVHLELAERFPDLAEEGIDILFGVTMAGAVSLVQKRVADTRYIFCCSPEYRHQYGIPQTPSDLSHHRYITHSMRQPSHILFFKDNLEIEVNPILYLNDSRAMCDCAIAGMGIVKLHDYIVADAIKAGQLVEVLADFHDAPQCVYLYYQQSRHLQPKIRKFIDFYT